MEEYHINPLPGKDLKAPPSKLPKTQPPVIQAENIIQQNLIQSHKFNGAPVSKQATRPPKKKRKINRHFSPDVRLDLHGNTRAEAIEKLNHLIPKCLKNNLPSLLIITGKGLHSETEKGVLREAIWEYLAVLKHEGKIEAFNWAPNHLGGKGAILVFV